VSEFLVDEFFVKNHIEVLKERKGIAEYLWVKENRQWEEISRNFLYEDEKLHV
jgi:hypothetical protein